MVTLQICDKDYPSGINVSLCGDRRRIMVVDSRSADPVYRWCAVCGEGVIANHLSIVEKKNGDDVECAVVVGYASSYDEITSLIVIGSLSARQAEALRNRFAAIIGKGGKLGITPGRFSAWGMAVSSIAAVFLVTLATMAPQKPATSSAAITASSGEAGVPAAVPPYLVLPGAHH